MILLSVQLMISQKLVCYDVLYLLGEEAVASPSIGNTLWHVSRVRL